MTDLVDLNHSLAKRIRSARDEATMTQAEFAARLGVSVRTLQNWEAGVSFPRAKHRRALTEVFSRETAA